MKNRLLRRIAAWGLTVAALAISALPALAQSPALDIGQLPVIVSDFELHSLTTRPAKPASPAPSKPSSSAPASSNTSKGKPGQAQPPVVYEDDDTPSAQAQRLREFFAVTLAQVLAQNGFTATTRKQGDNPSNGVLIRGVFAEPDAKNQIRRALLGTDAPSAHFLLYVGIFNLSKPDQPLYQPAPVQDPSDPRFGPVITLNNYIPLAKYELDKDPTEEQVRKICMEIAASLKALVVANPNAFSS